MERPAIPPLKPALVREFVAQAHADLERVKQLIEQEPRLINGVWDWGGGDWETALGAAAHMGRADIARYLLAHGARMDLFAAAMLGELAVVQAIITAHPEAARGRPARHPARGPCQGRRRACRGGRGVSGVARGGSARVTM